MKVQYNILVREQKNGDAYCGTLGRLTQQTEIEFLPPQNMVFDFGGTKFSVEKCYWEHDTQTLQVELGNLPTSFVEWFLGQRQGWVFTPDP